jgi:6-phospho-beta-glucosidase
MARIKVVYLGGGSTRAAGTVASLIEHGDSFQGSEVVLVDLDQDRLTLIERLARRMAEVKGVDLTIRSTTDRRAALDGADAVLSSFRPGGFEARVQDERLPLRHGVIGQETQGPGGFFMALRAITVLKEVCAEMEQACPDAWIFNYTNPVNLVAQAVSRHSGIRIVSLCEGPIYFADDMAHICRVDRSRLHAKLVGLNHACWSVEHTYDGEDFVPIIKRTWDERRDDPSLDREDRRVLQLAATMESIPAEYFRYYYFRDEILAELAAKPTTRAEDIIAESPSYWDHYREQAQSDRPQLDPGRSRGGISELELAIDVMGAIFNDTGDVYPVNVPNRGGCLPGFPEDLVVEITGRCGAGGIEPIPSLPLPAHVRGLVMQLGEYQSLAADAAWCGSRIDAIRALCANPLVQQLPVAERLYADLAEAHRRYLPDRLAA